MTFRVCKSFFVESGHMLSKHPGLCKHPHGHSRRIDVVLRADRLDGNDMVCDFKALKLAVQAQVDRYDHALAVNSNDPILKADLPNRERVIVFQNTDPTTEVMAKDIFDHLTAELAAGKTYTDDRGNTYRFPAGIKLERVRVSETATTWAEYGE